LDSTTELLKTDLGFKVIPRAALAVKDLVGKGSFGDVHLCEYQGATCAAKVIKRYPGISSNSDQDELSNKVILKEAQAMEHCKNHPHVVNLFGVCIEAREIMLVSEYCEMGSLYDVIVRPRSCRYTPNEVLALAKQGVSGMVHLHSLNVVHRDIAARNFLMTKSGIVKVCDFGLAKIKPNKNAYSNYNAKMNPLRWAAPESLVNNEFSLASDVFMTGTFLWELWFRDKPFAALDNFQAALQVINGARPAVDDEALTRFPEFVELLGQCWQEAPADRPDMTRVMEVLAELIDKYRDVRRSPARALAPSCCVVDPDDDESKYKTFSRPGSPRPDGAFGFESDDDDESVPYHVPALVEYMAH